MVRLLHWSAFLLSLSWPIHTTALNEPVVFTTSFSEPLSKLIYFDNSPTILSLHSSDLWQSDNNGATWRNITDTFKGESIEKIHIDKYHKDRIFVLTRSQTQFFTKDQGKNWKSFQLNCKLSDHQQLLIGENVKTEKNILINILDCSNNFSCSSDYYYTNDEFQTDLQKLDGRLQNVVYCSFSATATNKDNNDHLLCITNEYDSRGRVKATDLLSSDDFFKTQETIISDGINDALLYDLEISGSFIVIKAYSDRFSDESYVDLFVSKDGKSFRKAHFPGDLKSESFTILPSDEHSLYVSVWGLRKKASPIYSSTISDLYASDSDGYTFKRLDNLAENSKFYGFHSVEKISELDGVWLGNILEGYDDFSFYPSVVSKMSFDDGRSWQDLKYEIDPNSKTKSHCDNSENCHLNILKAVEMAGDGTFESGQTPGILFGMGSVSPSQTLQYDKLSTWVSRDGGYSWTVALDMPCVFSIGDQGNIVVAIPYYSIDDFADNDVDRSKFYYSFDQGKTWKSGSFNEKIFPTLLTTTIDGSSQKFVFAGYSMSDKGQIFGDRFHIFSLDFSNIFDGKTCDSSEFEKFTARKHDTDLLCIMGHKEIFNRRKQDSQCFVNQLYKDLAPTYEKCSCQKTDYECSKGFIHEKEQCVPDFRYLRHVCVANPTVESKMEILSKIPGDTCDEGKPDSFNYHDNEYLYDLNCEDIIKNSASSDISVAKNRIPGKVIQYKYLDQSVDEVKDETILLLNDDNSLYISHNGGSEFFWAFVDGQKVLAIMENPFNSDNAVLITSNKYLYVSQDRAQTFMRVDIPSEVNLFGHVPVFFHPTNSSKMIFIGSTATCEKDPDSIDCKSAAYLTEDGGSSWIFMFDNARTCDFAGARFKTNDSFILCEQLNGDRSVKIISSQQEFQDTKEIVTSFEHAVGFALDDGFIVVAEFLQGAGTLKSLTTTDGINWAHAKFPHDLHVGLEQAYTVLKTNSKSIFLHVTTNSDKDKELGPILKSNSNGTSYVLIEDYVNRDSYGYVDFEKIEGIEGLAIVNVVSNAEDVLNLEKSTPKQLKTKITHNDGAEWAYLAPPSIDSKGVQYDCVKEGQPFTKCSLNLHGFTERSDYRDTYSSGSATGMMIGIGSVGEYLGDISTASTFLSCDAGITWKEISKKPLNWEFGDQGGIIVLIDQTNPTKEFLFSLDEGKNWESYEFNSEPLKFKDLVTIPSDTSRRFVIISESVDNDNAYTLMFGIDFHEVFSRQCVIDFDDLDSISNDFDYWTPKHPFLADNCLFGHESHYLRRKPERSDCFIGSAPLNEGFRILRNCSCSRRDYECDYNFARNSDKTCELVPGLAPKDPKEVCVNEKAIEYFNPTGYRRIPMSTCVDGLQLDHHTPKPCPGKEALFNHRHKAGLHGIPLLLAIIIPLGGGLALLWYVYEKGIRRNGGFSRLGAIRLEENGGFGFPTRVEDTTSDKIVNKIVDLGVVLYMGINNFINIISNVKNNLVAGKSPFTPRNKYDSISSTRVIIGDQDDLFGMDEDDSESDNVTIDSNEDDEDATPLGV